jgi:hypothetical protein
MKRFLSVRSFIVALTVVAGVLGLFAAFSETEAFAGICTYYSGPNHQTVVGQRGTDCCGEPVNWGVITQFRTCEQVYCVWCPPPTQ